MKADGISFVFIRCSYTSLKSFNLHTDPKFKANVTAAAAAGLKVGVYHYSGATSATEAKKEANYVVNLLKPYKSKITLPVMFDYEPGERVTANYKKTSKTRSKNLSAVSHRPAALWIETILLLLLFNVCQKS